MIPGAGIFRTKLPQGFLAGGINCGVRLYRPDLGTLVSTTPSVAVGVFTQSTFKAAPVVYSQNLLPATNIKAIITNSGQANAGTGEQGVVDNLAMVQSLAHELNCAPEQILSASTGVIGEPMALTKITQAMPTLVNNLTNIAEKFALAILTTDLVPKSVYQTVKLSLGEVHITGICKGSGMIHPNMATMLGYILTDAQLTVDQSQTLLNQAVDKSFNMISVDGETSTNDCVFMLANGTSQVKVTDSKDLKILSEAIENISILLAKSITRDGEGSSKLIEICVNNAPDTMLAKKLARTLTVSPLIKTAIYGESPNWGRIVARLGMAQCPAEILAKCSIYIQGNLVFSAGQPTQYDASGLSQKMQTETIAIEVDLHAGQQSATAWGCDLTEKYIKINAEYLT